MEGLTPADLDRLLDAIRGVNVLVVGDLMLDVYLRGSVSRVSPEAPVPVVRVDEEWRALGGAANVASNVVALGAECTVLGCVGRDRAGEGVRREMDRIGIDAARVQTVDGRPTTVKTRILAQQQQVARFDREVDHAVDERCADALITAIDELAAAADVVILEDYDKGVLIEPVIAAALDAARRAGRPVVVDPKARHFFDYGGATVFKPNRTELASALGGPVLAEDADWMERTRQRLDCEHLLVTLGAQGMALRTGDGGYSRIAAAARSVFDVSGAGDTVTAAVAVALAADATPLEAALLANHAAGEEVAKAGVATVEPDELRAAVRAREIPAEG